jgi:Flp pilus assembly protein protease CpaA
MIMPHEWLGLFQVLIVILVSCVLLGATVIGILEKWRDVKLELIRAEKDQSKTHVLPWGGEVK